MTKLLNLYTDEDIKEAAEAIVNSYNDIHIAVGRGNGKSKKILKLAIEIAKVEMSKMGE